MVSLACTVPLLLPLPLPLPLFKFQEHRARTNTMKLSQLAILGGASVALAQVPLKFDILRGSSFQNARKLSKKDIVVGPLADEQSFYGANIVVGGTQINVLVDTGSSDLWVYGSDNPFCESTGSSGKERIIGASPEDVVFSPRLVPRAEELESTSEDVTATASLSDNGGVFSTSISPSEATMDCSIFGLFDTAENWETENQTFFIQYGDNSFALGTWGESTLTFGNGTIDHFTLAVANLSNSTAPVLGIGLEGNEASTAAFMENYGGAFQYQNFPSALKQAGLIQRNLYSLYMDTDLAEGSVLFGGIDHAKYSGDLVMVPLFNYYAASGMEVDQPLTFDILLDDMTLIGDNENTTVLSEPISALLDSGTSYAYLPTDTITALVKALDAKMDSDLGFYVLDCSSGKTGFNLTFTFGDAVIPMPIANFLEATDESGEKCALLAQESDRYILGDLFLRGAYVVYDLEGLQVGLAPVLNTEDEDIEVIGTDFGSAILNATATGSASAVGSQTITASLNIGALSSALFDSPGESSVSGSSIETMAFSTSATASASSTGTSSKNIAAGLSISGVIGILFMML